MSAPGLADRVEVIEEGLRALQAELADVRRELAAGAPVPPVEAPGTLIEQAREELERRRWPQVIRLANEALEQALRERDDETRAAIVSLAGIAANSAPSHLLPQALDLANRAAGHPPTPKPTPKPEPEPEIRPPAAEPKAVVTAVAAAPPPPRARARRTPRVELTDARVFALTGGVVTLLGVIFLFVLAANRGWIGPAARVSIGAAASIATIGAGIAVRARFGRLQASLAAVGAGVAGAYATLAASTILYGFLPTWGALLVAALIAATGASLALRWSSQLLAGLSLVGAAAAPASVALDDGIVAGGTAFAIVVLAAALAAAAPRGWVWLAAAVGVAAVGQVMWLVADVEANDAAAIAVVAGASLVLVGGSLVWQAFVRTLSQVAASLALAGSGVAFAGLVVLLPDNRAAGIALAVSAGVYGLIAFASLRRFPLLAQVIGASALALAAISTAYLLSERSLTIAWAIEAAALAALARRINSPRFELGALGYLALGIVHAFVVDILLNAPARDLPPSSAAGLFTLAASAALVGAFALGRLAPGGGGRFDVLWQALVAQRELVRFWLWGAAVALLAGATVAALSGTWLTVAFAVEACVAAVAGRRVVSPHLGVAALAYVAVGVCHAFAVDVVAGRPAGDLPTSSAPGLFSLSAAALLVGVLAVGVPRSWRPGAEIRRGPGVARGSVRLSLWITTVALAAFGTAAVLSGRPLTLAWAAAAVVLAIAAAVTGERRLQAVALALFGTAAMHSVIVEAPPGTLVLGRDRDALDAVPSLTALAGSATALALLSSFTERGLAYLGPLEDAEAILSVLSRRARELRDGLAVVATGFALWAATLIFVAIAYEPGQTIATALWSATAIATAVVAGRRRSTTLALLALPPVALAYGKAVGFDTRSLGDRAAAVSILCASAAVLLVGFCGRFAAPGAGRLVTAAAWVTAIVAVDSALEGVDLLSGDQTRAFGAGALLVAIATAALAILPFRAWRRADPPLWARNVATCYWGIGLAVLVLAETALIDSSLTKTAAAGAVTAALVATAARPLGETRLWLVGCVGTCMPTLLCLGFQTPPSRLVVASGHPGAGLWALLVCIGGVAWVAARTPDVYRRAATPLLASAFGLAVFGLSLGVLEVAERVSGASVQTDFQRGHTAVSAVWGILALVGFVEGLTRGNRLVQRAGLALFGVALAKLFLYDLSTLSSVTRAFSFLAVGAVLLTAAFFAERLIHGPGPGGPRPAL